MRNSKEKKYGIPFKVTVSDIRLLTPYGKRHYNKNLVFKIKDPNQDKVRDAVSRVVGDKYDGVIVKQVLDFQYRIKPIIS